MYLEMHNLRDEGLCQGQQPNTDSALPGSGMHFKSLYSSGTGITCVASHSSYLLLSNAPGLNKIKFMCYALSSIEERNWINFRIIYESWACINPVQVHLIKGKTGNWRPMLCAWWKAQLTLGDGDKSKQYHFIHIKSSTNPGKFHKKLPPSNAQIRVHWQNIWYMNQRRVVWQP